MRRLTLLAVPAFFFCATGFCQSSSVVEGWVLDSLTRQPIGRVSIFVKDSFLQARCDDSGRFQLALPAGLHALRFQHIAYKPAERIIRLNDGERLSLIVLLQEKDFDAVGTITVTAERASQKQSSRYDLSPKGIRNVPPLGEPDLMRALALLPSITQPNDLKASFNVRGGSSDQNQILLDGIEIYNPNHLLGLFSAFNISAIEKAEVYAANFPAEFGNRLSSVISITTRASADTAITTGNVSLLSSSLTLARQWDKSFVLLAGRITYLDWITRLFGRRFPYGFYDANLKFRQGLSEQFQAEMIGFASSDTFLPSALEPPEAQDPDGLGRTTAHTWGVRMLALRLRAVAEKSQHALTGSFSQNFVNFDYLNGVGFIRNNLSDFTLRTDSEVRLRLHNVKFGVEFKRLQAAYHWDGSDARFPLNIYLYPNVAARYQNEQGVLLFSAYVSNEWIVADALALQAALRYTTRFGFSLEGLSPRLSASWQASDAIKLFGSVGRYAQFVAEGREGQEGSIGSPLFALERPNAAWILALGLMIEAEEEYRITAEAYHKIFSSIVELDVASPTALQAYPTFRYGSGAASGVDVFIEKARGAVTFQVAYSFLASEVLFGGERYAPDWDAPHSFKGLIGWKIDDAQTWSFNVAAIFRSGTPVTPVVGAFLGPGGFGRDLASQLNPNDLNRRFINGERNSIRLPFFLRVDVSLRKEFYNEKSRWTLYFQALNVFNFLRQNAARYDWARFYNFSSSLNAANSGGISASLPIVPSLGVEFSF